MTQAGVEEAHDVIRVHQDPAALDAAAWNDLLQAQAAPSPLMRHEYLAALHASGSAVPSPRFTAHLPAITFAKSTG